MNAALALVLVALVASALWTLQASLLRATIGLLLVSLLLTTLLFLMDAPLAGVFELSVCAGLVTVMLVSSISLTRPLSDEAAARCRTVRARRFHPAILTAACAAAVLWVGGGAIEIAPAAAEASASVREVLWDARRLTLVAQVALLLAGAFGVVVFFRRGGEGVER